MVAPKLRADLPQCGHQSLIRALCLWLCPCLPGRVPTYCSVLSFISIDLIQNWLSRSNRHWIKIIKFTMGFVWPQVAIYPAGLLVIQGFVNFLVYYCNHRVIDSVHLASRFLTRFNKIAIQGTPQMAVDKEAICLSRVYSYYPKCNFPLFYV